MLFTVVVLFHVIVAIGLVLVVLLQSSKGDAMAGSAFGGGGGGASFGPTRGNALSKATTVLAIIFMFNCIVLTYMSAQSAGVSATAGSINRNTRSVVTEQMQKEIEKQQAAAGQQVTDDGSTEAPLNLDSLVQVAPAGDTGSTPADSQ